jgi:trehalose synthase
MDSKVPCVEDYEPLVGSETVERTLAKAERFACFHVTHINSTYYGGGVAELLNTLTLLLNGLGSRPFVSR